MQKFLRSEKIDTHGGSIRIYIKKDKKVKIEPSVKKMLKRGREFLELKDLKLIKNLVKKFIKSRENVLLQI